MGNQIQSKIATIRDDIRSLRLPEAQPGAKNVLAIVDRLAVELEIVKREGMLLNYRLNHLPLPEQIIERSKRKQQSDLR